MAKNCNRFPFYKRNPFKIFREKKKKKWNHLQFYKRNPFKNESDQKKKLLQQKAVGKLFTFETIFQKVTVVLWFWKKIRRPPTYPKFNTHKKIVLHFFTPMLFLPKTPPLIYLKLKKIKGPKMDSLFFHFSLSLHFSLWSGDGVEYLSRPRYRPPTPMVRNCNAWPTAWPTSWPTWIHFWSFNFFQFKIY